MVKFNLVREIRELKNQLSYSKKYGFFFGAPWFLPRYFFPLSPLLSVLVITSAGEWLRKQTARPVMQGLALASAIGMLLAGSYVSLRQYHRGIHHPHFQVVEWVRSEVPARVWVGAIQTGTLGFFHDRTVNLDGKVNIHAYEALVQKREAEYVVKDTSIQYLVDWVGMKDWMNKPLVADNFELFESDSERNLEILRRRPGQDARERLD